MSSYLSTKEVFDTTVRVSKEDSAFLYFIMEGHENMCFYSTLDALPGQGYRDVRIRSTIEFKDDVKYLLEKFENDYPLEVLEEVVTIDS